MVSKLSKLSQRLKELREEKGLTQDQLAKIFNVENPTINRYEKNKRGKTFDILVQFADFFDVSVDYLLGRTDFRKLVTGENVEKVSEGTVLYNPNAPNKINLGSIFPPEDTKLFMKIQKLSDEQRKIIETLVDQFLASKK